VRPRRCWLPASPQFSFFGHRTDAVLFLAHIPRTLFYASAPDARKVDDSDIRLSITFVWPSSGLVLIPLPPDWCDTRGRIEPVYDRCLRDHHVQVRSYPGQLNARCLNPHPKLERSS
jgi:hypothetical protein